VKAPRSRAARWSAIWLLATAWSVLLATPAAAHPADEIVQQVYLTPTAAGLTVQLDLVPGVLVAPQFARVVDVDGNGTLTPAEVDTHVAAVRSALTARVDGRVVELAVTEHRYPPVALLAAGGGTVTVLLAADLPAQAQWVELTDRYDPGPSTVQMSVLLAPDRTQLGRISRGDGGRAVSVALAPDAAAPSDAAAASTASTSRASAMLDALRRPLTSPWALLALVAACTALGALHALAPGHGKALLAAYLVGGRGTPRHAVGLGIVITVSHTSAVLALGGAALVAGRYLVPGAVVPVLTTVAGAVVLVLGARLVRRHWAGIRTPVHHGHGHGHGHRPGPPTRLPSLAAMGMSAGMIPCPEALSVLLLAIGLNRTALGLVMIVAFSVGLAAVLVGLGLVLVGTPSVLSRATDRRPAWVARVPLLSALVVAVLGAVMTATGVGGLLG
jgi:ABC-type nickel/cobalt efflux system permease component RcnA